MLISSATAVAAAGGTGYVLLKGGSESAAALPVQAAAATTKSGSAASGAAAATVASGGTAAASRTSRTSRTSAFNLDKHLDHDLLVGRATYGRTPTIDRSIDRLGASAWLERQLRPASIKDPRGLAVDAKYPDLRWSTETARAKLNVGAWDLMMDTCAVHLGRAMFSSRDLHERMVDFWSNHLNIACPGGDVWDTRHRYQIDVIRKYAMASFEQLLLASAFHPSMLVYLNGAQSTGQEPNENYAREVLELHTVGVNGGYTEKDIQRSAKLLTGWTVQDGKAFFDQSRHHLGTVKAFGFTAKNADPEKGPASQRRYLRYLANHPRTARHIATKLATHFVSDNPPKSLIVKLTAAYKKHDTAIVPVLRALFSSPEFAESGGQKIRRPMEQFVASARAIGVKNGKDSNALMDVYYIVKDAGHGPLGWPMPNGFADTADSWQSPAGALNVFNSTTAMVHGWWPSKMTLPGPSKLLPTSPVTRAAAITAVGKKVFGRKPTTRERSAAVKLLSGTKLPATFRTGSWEQQETVALTASLFLAAPAHLSV